MGYFFSKPVRETYSEDDVVESYIIRAVELIDAGNTGELKNYLALNDENLGQESLEKLKDCVDDSDISQEKKEEMKKAIAIVTKKFLNSFELRK